MSDSESEAVGRGEIWIEKYRPESLDGVVGHPEITDRLKSYVARNDLPNLLFSGPAGTGKCVTGETPVLTNRGVERIENFVEVTDGFGEPDPGLEVATFDDDGSVRFVEPSRTYSKKADELVSVRTRDGIETEVTSEHPLLVIDHDGLEWKEASQLAPGDRIARPLSMPTPVSDARIDWPSAVDPKRIFVDLSESFVEEHDIPIEENHVGAKKVVLKRLRNGDTVDEIAADTDIRRKTVRSYEREFRDVNLDRSVTTCSLAYLTELDIDHDEFVADVESIQYVTHANNNRSRSITPPSELTPDLAAFVGLAISEPRIDGGRVQFYNADDTLLERFENTAERVFDVETSRGENKGVPYVEIASRTLTHYLESCFDVFAGATMGDGIGSRLVRADEASRAAFLRAVFDAEGYISTNGIVELTQKNERLITLLAYLLASFGIRSRRERETKAATNGSGIEREYHTLRISGSADLRRFEEAIGFTLEEKADRLAGATARESNPNDDTIPVQNSVARLREGLYLSSSDLLTETLNPETPGRENYPGDLERVRDAALERLEAAQDTQERIANLRGELGAIAKTPAEWVDTREALQPLERRRAVGDATGIRADYLLENDDHDIGSLPRFLTLADRMEDRAAGMLSTDVLSDLRSIEHVVDADLHYDVVEGVERIDQDTRVYDLTVPGSHNYVAGNLPTVMHNTASSVAIARELYGEDWNEYFLELNASDDRGIDVVRNQVKNFADKDWRGRTMDKPSIIFLDEADALTDQAQSALRRTMEQYSDKVRFIFSCNFSSQIIDPIQSRCAVFRFSGISDEAVAERIRGIADQEGIEYTDDGIDALVYAAAGDMRKAINGLQAAAVMGETVDEDAVYTITSTARPEEIEAMVESALAGEFTAARSTLDTLLTENGLAGGDIIDQLHRSAWDFDLDDEAAVRLMDRVGEADYRIAEGANERVQLEALLASIALENGA
jgi:DNA polymerase III delta prime subunit